MSPVAVEREPIIALDDEQPALAEAEHLLEYVAGGSGQAVLKLVGPDGEEVELPQALFRVIIQAVHHLRRGNGVAVAPLHKELTTQQAADLLNVSRPYLVQLLEEGRIPFTKTGTHRRVRLSDVLAYKQQRDVERRGGMRRLAALSQELGLYDL